MDGKISLVIRAGLTVALAMLLAACGSPSRFVTSSGPITTEGLTLAWSPDGEWIVFPSSTNGGTAELYALNVGEAMEGAGREAWVHLSQEFSEVIDPVDVDSLTYLHLAWSPDGERIAFTAGDAVYTIEAECLEAPVTCADSLVKIIGGASAWMSLEWSPDSTMLLLESTIAGPTVKTDKGVLVDDLVNVMRVVAADGSGDVLLERKSETRQAPDYVQHSAFSPAWSPDGTQIVYASGVADQAELYTIALDGEQVLQLTQTPDLEEFNPSWSPDGGTIMYSTNSEGQQGIYVLNLKGGEPTCVTCGVKPSWKHRLLWSKWSADGAHIAYGISGKRIPFQKALPYYLYVIAPDGGDQVPIVEEGFPGPPFWSPDGSRLAFAFRPRPFWDSWESDIFVIKPDGSALTNVTE